MPPIRPELLDELLRDYRKPDDLLGQNGLLQQLTKALVERSLNGELTHHPGYEKRSLSGEQLLEPGAVAAGLRPDNDLSGEPGIEAAGVITLVMKLPVMYLAVGRVAVADRMLTRWKSTPQ